MMLEKTLIHDEGKSLKVYWDHLGYPTIGIGHLIMMLKTRDMGVINSSISQQVGRRINNGIITDEECSKLFQSDIQKATELMKSYSDLYRVFCKLDPVRQTAIMNMCFQLGCNGVSKFKKMIAALDKRDWAEAKRQGLDSNWAKQTPARANRVTNVFVSGTLDGYPK